MTSVLFICTFHLTFSGSQLVYTGTKLSYTATDLAPHTQYAYRVRAFTQGDDSPMSDITSTVTQETGEYTCANVVVMLNVMVMLEVVVMLHIIIVLFFNSLGFIE